MFKLNQLAKFVNLNHRRLAHIKRYNTTPLAIQESVAEHSYFVAFYAMLLCEYVEQRGTSVDKLKVLQRCLVHDIEEVISGDIIMTFKHKNEETAKMFERMNNESIDDLFKDLPENYAKKLKELWKNSKDDTIEGKIVSIADKMSLLTYCNEQIKTGNKFMGPVFERGIEALCKIKCSFAVKLSILMRRDLDEVE